MRLQEAYAADEAKFDIVGFVIEGNTLLPERPLAEDYKDAPIQDVTLQEVLEEFIGKQKSAEDIEQARLKLEQTYHEKGYPTVVVNIPEQTVQDGLVTLQVIESAIRRTRVTGNRYFTMENILQKVPTLREGQIIYLPHLKQELLELNSNPDLQVEPVLVPGKEFGTVDVELKVKDELPLHGGLEFSNRASEDTTSLRLNGIIRYENLWQKEHSISLQYQTSPENTSEVQVIAGSYVLPSPWNSEHRIALYSIWSDSDTAFGEGFQVIGKGVILGGRYVMPLAPYKEYTQNVSVGLDYKDFSEETGYGVLSKEQRDLLEDLGLKFPVKYLPLTVSYNSSLADDGGLTSFSASLNMAFRGVVAKNDEFADKRYLARTNYLYLTAGVERMQKLPWDSSLYVKVDGQVADQPLLSNEQYAAGGMESVRGYKENLEVGDNAVHSTVELTGPDLAKAIGVGKAEALPYIFYDMAYLWVKNPLPGQQEYFTMQGTGLGLRGKFTDYLEYQLDWAFVLSGLDSVDAGDSMVHFMFKFVF